MKEVTELVTSPAPISNYVFKQNCSIFLVLFIFCPPANRRSTQLKRMWRPQSTTGIFLSARPPHYMKKPTIFFGNH